MDGIYGSFCRMNHVMYYIEGTKKRRCFGMNFENIELTATNMLQNYLVQYNWFPL